MDFCHLREIYLTNMEKNHYKLLKKGTNASKKLIHKAAEAAGEFLGNKIAETLAKSYDDRVATTKHITDGNSRNIEEIIIPPQKTKLNI